MISSIVPEKIIGITGGSCSGKTTLEKNLQLRFGEQLALFPFDDMFVGRAALAGATVTDWEDPSLYRWEDFVGHVRDLASGRAVDIVANSRESKEAGFTHRHIEPKPIILIAGFLALHDPAIRQMLDAGIYLNLSEEEIVRRRRVRANPDSPWDSETYISQKLLPGHRRVVLPQRALADHVVEANTSPDRLADEIARIINETSQKM